MFKTINENVSGEILEKKSKFIANVFYIETVEEAENIIKEIKKKHILARHNCYAFSVMTKDGIINRFSDDGEPSGTAGSPMLNIITSKNLTNILVVVTRYFGGTLLGTGGLVRAYGQSAKVGIQNALVMRVCEGVSFDLRCDYNSIGKIKYIMGQMNISAEEEYGEDVNLHINMKKSDLKNFQNQVVDATSGKAVWGEIEETQYKENIEK